MKNEAINLPTILTLNDVENGENEKAATHIYFDILRVEFIVSQLFDEYFRSWCQSSIYINVKISG